MTAHYSSSSIEHAAAPDDSDQGFTHAVTRPSPGAAGPADGTWRPEANDAA